MKYHLSAVQDATPENWRVMLHALTWNPVLPDEKCYVAMSVAARSAQILRNRRDEMLAFLDSFWNEQWGTAYGRPIFETSAPHQFSLVRHHWGLDIEVRHHDYTGTGLPSEGIHFDISSKDPERVRRFAYEAARDLEQKWFGSLHDGNISFSGSDLNGSVDHAVDALIKLAKEKEAAAAAVATA